MKNYMVYLASPYSADGDTDKEQERFEQAAQATFPLIQRYDTYVFSPIAYSHPLYVNGWASGGDWKYWVGWDTYMVLKCDELWVLMLPGWEDSVGVKAEMQVAHDAGMPIAFVNPMTMEVQSDEYNRTLTNEHLGLRTLPSC